MRYEIISAMFAMTLIVGTAGPAQGQQPPNRSITQVVGNLYVARNIGHNTVFLVTPEGIVLSDPINREFSAWLRSELEQRFDVPVRYVIYSHHHWDHASGGEVFAGTADFVGHYSFAEAIARPNPATPIPGEFAELDGNGNAVIDRSEASGPLVRDFDLYDVDGNGGLSGAELMGEPLGDVYPPNIFYTDGGYAVTLGGSRVELTHVGPIEAPDMTVLRFPHERAVFVVDFMSPERLPRTDLSGPLRAGATIDEWIDAAQTVEAMEFDIIIPGHGDVGTYEQAATFSGYLEALRDGVAEQIEKGASLENIQATVLLEDYSDWANYDVWRAQNIAGMYKALTEGR